MSEELNGVEPQPVKEERLNAALQAADAITSTELNEEQKQAYQKIEAWIREQGFAGKIELAPLEPYKKNGDRHDFFLVLRGKPQKHAGGVDNDSHGLFILRPDGSVEDNYGIFRKAVAA